MEGFADVSARIGANPSKYTQAQMTSAFRRYAGGNMVSANVISFTRLKKLGHHREGKYVAVSTDASKAVDNHNDRGLEVAVTVCQDQRALKIVDKFGRVVASQQKKIPPFNLRQYTVLKPKGQSLWKVYAMSTVKGECGP